MGAVCFLIYVSAAITPEQTELELTGGPLSNVFDSFFRYVPRATLFKGNNYGKKFTNVETFFTRGTKDHVQVPGVSNADSTLPDGRFVLRATLDREEEALLSLVRASS